MGIKAWMCVDNSEEKHPETFHRKSGSCGIRILLLSGKIITAKTR